MKTNCATFKDQVFAQYGDELYVYNESTHEWDHIIPGETTVPKDEEPEMSLANMQDVERLEKRVDSQELEFEKLQKENRQLSMRLRRIEVNENLSDVVAAQKRQNIALWAAIACVSGYALVGSNVVGSTLSSLLSGCLPF